MNMREARNEMLALLQKEGELTPEIVKEAARPRAHPFHGFVFNKSPRDAAEAYYTERAHELLRVIRIRYPSIDPGDHRTIRAFQAVRGDGPSTYSYEPTEQVAADPFKKALVLREMEREWNQLKARYEDFAEFAEMIRSDLGEVA